MAATTALAAPTNVAAGTSAKSSKWARSAGVGKALWWWSNHQVMRGELEYLKSTIAFYGSTRSYRSSFEIDGWGDTADQLHKMSVQQKWPEMAKLVTEEMVHAFAAVGTYDQIASVIKKRFAGTNRLSFDMSIRNDHDRGVLKEIVQDLHRP
jgi:alkanesulfonate monooxygenase SsuD/methylene tetrahydromethanopterin reductase-like flavin-dependent oxidoreductase (luciferase family)